MNERRGVVLPLLLIVAGAVWLLQSIGVLQAGSWWQLSRLWPVLLIAIGLQIVFGASRAGRLIVVAVTVGLVIGGLYMLNGSGGVPVVDRDESRGGSTDGSSESVDIPLEGAQSAEIWLSPGIARLTVGAGIEGEGDLATGSIAHLRPGEPPSISVEHEEERIKLRIEEREHRGFTFWPFGPSLEFAWDLALTPDVPIDLDVDAGVGEISLDLREIKLENLELDVGVGSVTVDLPGVGAYKVVIDGGIGSIVVTIPEGFDAQIDADVGIGDVSVPDGLSVFGERWKTDGFDDATERVDITLDGGIGSIAVRVQE